MPQAFWNARGEPARIIEIHVPATFARFYDELGAFARDLEAPARMAARGAAALGFPCTVLVGRHR